MLRLSGYRPSHGKLLRGRWLPGELIAPQVDLRVPAFADGTDIPEPDGRDDERCLVAPGHGVLRFVDIDWIDRRTRIEIRLLCGFTEDVARTLLDAAIDAALGVFALNRAYGFVTPGGPDVSALLSSRGFVHELTLPAAVRVNGRPTEREVWAKLRER